MMRRVSGSVLFLISLLAVFAHAGEQTPPGEAAKPRLEPRRFVTRHKMALGRASLAYTAIAGDIILPTKMGVRRPRSFRFPT